MLENNYDSTWCARKDVQLDDVPTKPEIEAATKVEIEDEEQEGTMEDDDSNALLCFCKIIIGRKIEYMNST